MQITQHVHVGGRDAASVGLTRLEKCGGTVVLTIEIGNCDISYFFDDIESVGQLNIRIGQAMASLRKQDADSAKELQAKRLQDKSVDLSPDAVVK